MAANRPDVPTGQDPNGPLEQALIDEFLRAHGYDRAGLHQLPQEQVELLMKEAYVYAAVRLTEVESRAHYVHEIHGVGGELHKRRTTR